MKKIIDGKLYDTETADCLGGCEYLYDSDYCYYSETLYKTKRGTYFLTCKGNPLSPYVSYGDEDGFSGDRLKLLSHEEAKIWVEQNLSTEEYIKIFGDPKMG